MTRILSFIAIFATAFLTTAYATCAALDTLINTQSTDRTADTFLTAYREGQSITRKPYTPQHNPHGRLRMEDCTARDLTPHAYDPFTAMVVEVTDGDTLVVAEQGNELRVRLWGIDSPEMDQPLGPQAQQYLTSKTPPGSHITINPVALDRYGRIIATIGDKDSPSLNFTITAHGWAYHVDAYDAKGNRCLTSAEKTAQRYGSGVWGPGSSNVTPWEHRRENKVPHHSD